ncbi:hypothetical protein ACNI65_08675 [Roseateles sp. So40a]|uniref:hypothetical protein n=1 Tax=Roseateles sp. So40a TaxID=3400226 RepID=UPI003A89A3F3
MIVEAAGGPLRLGRLTVLCVGDRLLDPSEHWSSIQAIVAGLSSGQPHRLIEALRIDCGAVSQTASSWEQAQDLVAAPITPHSLLVAYFSMASSAGARQSISIDARSQASVISVSLDAAWLGDAGLATQAMLRLAAWASGVFDTAVLACGPELDLHEAQNAEGLPAIEAALASDWRCWAAMSIRRFRERAT